MNFNTEIRKEETNVRLAKALRDILARCADALDDPTNIKDVQEVLRDEAKNFEQDMNEAAARLRQLRHQRLLAQDHHRRRKAGQ
jgi:hypothetical protein